MKRFARITSEIGIVKKDERDGLREIGRRRRNVLQHWRGKERLKDLNSNDGSFESVNENEKDHFDTDLNVRRHIHYQ